MTVKKGIIDSQQVANDMLSGFQSLKEDIKADRPKGKEKRTILDKLEAMEELALEIKRAVNNSK
ncbi:MAG: hypothetical protein AB8G86_09390 [Saprospiraceae bacterium]